MTASDRGVPSSACGLASDALEDLDEDSFDTIAVQERDDDVHRLQLEIHDGDDGEKDLNEGVLDDSGVSLAILHSMNLETANGNQSDFSGTDTSMGVRSCRC